MLAHTGYRAVWPAVFFLPWLLVGLAYIWQGSLQRRHPLQGTRAVGRNPWLIAAALVVLGLAGLAVSRIARADESVAAAHTCAAPGPQEARVLADALYEKGDYQRAGACYDAAGDALRAQRAYLKAVGPSAEDTGHQLKEQSNSARALFTQVQGAFRSGH